MTDKEPQTIADIFDICESVGLPTTLAGIGLDQVSNVDLIKVATTSLAEGETIYNELIPVTPDLVFTALKATDAERKRRLSTA